ncbi:hypothetical protein LCGC14_2540880 [marine sediment metagenome]|uniref:Uncharacterized protein n=1 Tax=marine sediment metagenome TaxID=412755 RepID=A0A0F9BDJ5_9ZZZZ
MTLVVFRKDKEKGGDVFALFPTIASDVDGFYCMSYQHVGQHSGASYPLCIKNSRPATPAEYADLQAELVSIGYDDLKVCKRETAYALGLVVRYD